MVDRNRQYSALWAAGIALWCVAAGAGLAVLADYSLKPGEASSPPPAWPGALFDRAQDRPTLVMLAHPQCPCTRASIGELARLMAQAGVPLRAHVVFHRPGGFPEGWERTDLWWSAASIPGVEVWTDAGGVETARFGAITSGQVLLYDAAGSLLFSGGITPGRGHAGDNTGRQALRDLLRGKPGPPVRHAVFGCALRSAHAGS